MTICINVELLKYKAFLPVRWDINSIIRFVMVTVSVVKQQNPIMCLIYPYVASSVKYMFQSTGRGVSSFTRTPVWSREKCNFSLTYHNRQCLKYKVFILGSKPTSPTRHTRSELMGDVLLLRNSVGQLAGYDESNAYGHITYKVCGKFW